MSNQQSAATDSQIAIVGVACRFPGADSMDAFWRNLKEGRDTVTFFTDEELRAAGVSADVLANPSYVKASQCLDDIEQFDAELFGIPSGEAEILDPQQRLLLECASEALENASCNPDTFKGSIGVYAGVGMNTYLLHNLHDRFRNASSVEHFNLMLANDKDFVATRISYRLGLTGPSINVNTACSTSLVCTHLACLSLLNGECDMALAGSASIRVPRVSGYFHQDGMIHSSDGHCRAFDARADGTVIGDGGAVIVLKRLSDAVRDKDHIHGIILSSAINNDGANKTGYTAPSVAGQRAVLAEALGMSGISADTLGYVEAHGTGTRLGDPIELAALTQVFAAQGVPAGSCAIGSVKTNIGHLDTAAGFAGLLKCLLMLRHRTLVPSLHFKTENPEISFAKTPFYVNTEVKPWGSDHAPLRAAVSSFGIGGTNAHLILEERPRVDLSEAVQCEPRLLVLSAPSVSRLERLSESLASALHNGPARLLQDAAFSLGTGRRAYACRQVLLATDVEDAALTLALRDASRVHSCVLLPAVRKRVRFVLRGNLEAGQLPVARLYSALEEYRSQLDELIREVGATEWRCHFTSDAAYAKALADPRHAASVAFLATLAWGRVWIHWGVTPDEIVCDGTGEYVAGCLAGVLKAADILGRNLSDSLGCTYVPIHKSEPAMPFTSPEKGDWIDSRACEPAYWGSARRQLLDRIPDCFNGSESETLSLDICCAGGVRLTTVQGAQGVDVVEDPSRCIKTRALEAIGELWLNGVPIDWERFYQHDDARHCLLPTQPLERRRYWVQPEKRVGEAPSGGELLKAVRSAVPAARVSVLMRFLQEQILSIVGTAQSTDAPDPAHNIMDIGITSLEIVEIVAKLSQELNAPLKVSALIEHPTLLAFASHVVGVLGLPEGGSPRADSEYDRSERGGSLAVQRRRREAHREMPADSSFESRA